MSQIPPIRSRRGIIKTGKQILTEVRQDAVRRLQRPPPLGLTREAWQRWNIDIVSRADAVLADVAAWERLRSAAKESP